MALTTVDQGLLGTYAQYTGFKNRLINGGMVIDQRNAGASVTPNNVYTLDRWAFSNTQTGKLTIQQSSTAPTGFKNSLLVTSSSAYSVGSGDTFIVRQVIEGYNVADLGFGTASAATVTLSFWVRSSLTGTFGGALVNYSSDRSYPFSYTISSANTWEQKTITVAGDTSGTWLTSNSGGLDVRFGLGSGSTFSGTVNTWQAGNLAQPTGTVSVVGTNGATWYVTGVQLEKGSTATSFDYRPYGTELALCQRYTQVLAGGAGYRLGAGWAYASTAAYTIFNLPVSMRVAPSISGTASLITQNDGTAAYATSSNPGLVTSSETFVMLYATGYSGLTQFRPYQAYFANSSSTLVLSSEL